MSETDLLHPELEPKLARRTANHAVMNAKINAAVQEPKPVEPRNVADEQPFKITARGLMVNRDLTYDEWERCGKVLNTLRQSVQWSLGDWINYGEARYGEKYAQALSETDYDYGYLRNLAYVAARFDPSRRNDKVSWSHHMVLAGMEKPEEQDMWLKAAERGAMTRAELKAAIAPPKEPVEGPLMDIVLKVYQLPLDWQETLELKDVGNDTDVKVTIRRVKRD